MWGYFFLGTLTWPLAFLFFKFLFNDSVVASYSVSIFHGALTSMAGVITCKLTDSLDLIYGRAILESLSDNFSFVDLYASFSISYFAFDMVFLWKISDKISSAALRTFIGHHIYVLFLTLVVIFFRNGKGDYFIGCFFIFEFSNIFQNLRAILSHLGWKNSRLYVVNGVLMMISFFFCRLYMVYYMYSSYASYKSLDSVFGAFLTLPVVCNVGTASITLLQVYWWVLMVQGAAKLITKVSKHKIQ